MKLPFYEFYKSIDPYPEYFTTTDYWFYVIVSIILLIVFVGIVFLIYGSIYDYIDNKRSTNEYKTGKLVDKKYIGEQTTSGIGTAALSTGGVGVVSTSSHSDEEFLFFIQADKIYKTEVNMEQYYFYKIGEQIRFMVKIGGLSKYELQTQIL